MSTPSTKKSEIKRQWHLIDLDQKILGRVASQIAQLLIGKNKTNYTYNLDGGDYVIALNSDKIQISGRKNTKKIYYHHTGYPKGLRAYSFDQLMAKDSRKLITRAVKNMLPKNKLRADRLARLKVYKNIKHPYKDRIKKEKK